MSKHKKAKEMQNWVSSFSDDENEFLLYSPWGHQLQFAKKITKGESFGLVTTPLAKFPMDVTEKNLSNIKETVIKYMSENHPEKI